MINIAACAKDGVKIPNRQMTRDEIIAMFQKQMVSLRDHLSVSGNQIVYVSNSDHCERATMLQD